MSIAMTTSSRAGTDGECNSGRRRAEGGGAISSSVQESVVP